MEQATSNKVVRAIDLGYGFTKFIHNVTDKGDLRTASFPSIASIAGKKNLGGGFFAERDTVEVKHDGVMYEVGKDVVLGASAYSNRVLNKRYTQSNDYFALMKGALKMMKLNVIDTLVLGAPVNKYDEVKEFLKTSWRGDIDLDGNLKVRINKVIVLPQPLGGFALYGAQSGNYEKIKNQRNLIIDPGYFTFDWLLADNMKMMEGSNSYEGGMSFVIKAIVKELGNEADNLTTMTRIDEFFYNNKPFIFNGKEIDLNKYLPVAHSVIDKSVQTMVTSLSDLHNIDNIVVIGGAADIYLPIVQKHFKDRDVKVAKGKSFSNVMGFQYIGEALSNGKRKI